MIYALKIVAVLMILGGALALIASVFGNFSDAVDPVFRKMNYCLASLFILVVGLYLLVSYWR